MLLLCCWVTSQIRTDQAEGDWRRLCWKKHSFEKILPILFYFISFCHLLNTNANARSHCVRCLSAPLNLQFLYLILLNTIFIIHTHTTPCECSLWLSFTLIDSIYSFNAHSSHLAVDALFTVKILSRSSVFLNVECFFFNSKWILVFIGYNSAFCLHALLLIFNKFAFPPPNCASV